MKNITPEMQLEIRKEVEDRLLHLPSETLKQIQREIDERVNQTETNYKALFKVTALLLGAVLLAFFGVTWNTVSSRISDFLANTEIQKKTAEVTKSHQAVIEYREKIESFAKQMQETEANLRTRLAELKHIDNIVTYDQNGDVTMTMVNSQITLKSRAVPYKDNYCTMRFNPETGGISFETSVNGKLEFLTLK